MTEVSPPEQMDRSGRLALFGALSALIGAGLTILALLHLALLGAGDRLAAAGIPAPDLRSTITGFLLFVVAGIAFVWAGMGSIRKRRWVPPLTRTLAWIWMLTGATVTILAPALIRISLGSAEAQSGPIPQDLARLVTIAGTAFSAIAGVLLPIVYIRVYRDHDLVRTCEAADPDPSWTERCPPRLLGLSVGLYACAVLMVAGSLQAVIPAFGRLIGGLAGGVLMCVGAGIVAYLGRSTFRREMRGWWGTLVLMTLLGVSTIMTFLRVELVDYYRAMGYGDDQLEWLRQYGDVGKAPILWLTAAFMILTVVYMISIRKEFQPRGSGR